MTKHLASRRRARAITFSLFLVGLAMVAFTSSWWPYILLVIGIPLAIRQYLLGRKGDAFLSLAVFVGFFILSRFDIPWKILVPILLVFAAIYILCREFLLTTQHPIDEEDEDTNAEIEEDNKK